jgi:mono/diheme cytochrome c family protein
MVLALLVSVAVLVTTVWDGVFTSEQAASGSEAYQKNCVACHSPDLKSGPARVLVGDTFWQDWGEDRLSSLFNVIVNTMPYDKPHSLDESTYADILAFILQENGFPAGSQRLTSSSVAEIEVVRKSGSGPVPNFSLVSVVGCLTRQSNTTWMLTDASEPVRTRNPDSSTGEERSRATGIARAGNSFELMAAESAVARQEGHRAEVKGLLIRGSPDKINTTSIQALSDRCDP